MNKDQVKGAVKTAAGKMQKETGKLTGSVSQQIKGHAREAEGRAQKEMGDARAEAKDAAKSVKP